jgi:glucokinase
MKVKFNVTEFLLINDFEAASYGLMLVDDSEFVELNDKPINPAKLRGVIGPGTGLGHSVIFNSGQTSSNILVLPSEAGHSDIPFIDEESIEYINFLKQKLNAIYIDAEKAFCGPSIPYMYEFYFRKINESAVFE